MSESKYVTKNLKNGTDVTSTDSFSLKDANILCYDILQVKV